MAEVHEFEMEVDEDDVDLEARLEKVSSFLHRFEFTVLSIRAQNSFANTFKNQKQSLQSLYSNKLPGHRTPSNTGTAVLSGAAPAAVSSVKDDASAHDEEVEDRSNDIADLTRNFALRRRSRKRKLCLRDDIEFEDDPTTVVPPRVEIKRDASRVPTTLMSSNSTTALPSTNVSRLTTSGLKSGRSNDDIYAMKKMKSRKPGHTASGRTVEYNDNADTGILTTALLAALKLGPITQGVLRKTVIDGIHKSYDDVPLLRRVLSYFDAAMGVFCAIGIVKRTAVAAPPTASIAVSSSAVVSSASVMQATSAPVLGEGVASNPAVINASSGPGHSATHSSPSPSSPSGKWPASASSALAIPLSQMSRSSSPTTIPHGEVGSTVATAPTACVAPASPTEHTTASTLVSSPATVAVPPITVEPVLVPDVKSYYFPGDRSHDLDILELNADQDRVLASVDNYVQRVTVAKDVHRRLLSEEEVLIRDLCARAGISLPPSRFRPIPFHKKCISLVMEGHRRRHDKAVADYFDIMQRKYAPSGKNSISSMFSPRIPRIQRGNHNARMDDIIATKLSYHHRPDMRLESLVTTQAVPWNEIAGSINSLSTNTINGPIITMPTVPTPAMTAATMPSASAPSVGLSGESASGSDTIAGLLGLTVSTSAPSVIPSLSAPAIPASRAPLLRRSLSSSSGAGTSGIRSLLPMAEVVIPGVRVLPDNWNEKWNSLVPSKGDESSSGEETGDEEYDLLHQRVMGQLKERLEKVMEANRRRRASSGETSAEVNQKLNKKKRKISTGLPLNP